MIPYDILPVDIVMKAIRDSNTNFIDIEFPPQ